MSESSDGRKADNVTLTLAERKSAADQLAGRRFPCQLCGTGLEIRISRKLKPYTTCLSCGVQNFYRGKKGIRRLQKILDSHLFIAGDESSVDTAVLLFNRVQQLRALKKELTQKQAFVFSDSDLQNTIRVVDNEIERMQGELAKLARKSCGEKKR